MSVVLPSITAVPLPVWVITRPALSSSISVTSTLTTFSRSRPGLAAGLLEVTEWLITTVRSPSASVSCSACTQIVCGTVAAVKLSTSAWV